jgi:hypothetical protein
MPHRELPDSCAESRMADSRMSDRSTGPLDPPPVGRIPTEQEEPS